ncbi:MAG: hypothetical protein ACI9KN_001183 [Gammaproteobacteria bacterium]|jgi:hypothetical protein
MNKTVTAVVSWVIALWASNVFLSSIPYKFSSHPDTQHIFGTIGEWLKGFIGDTGGGFFVDYGAYIIGSAELVTSLILLSPLVFWLLGKINLVPAKSYRPMLHGLGGLMAAGIMAGAVFFHLVSPLGVEVLHQGESDGGSLFYAALSIFILGLVLSVINWFAYRAESQPD